MKDALGEVQSVLVLGGTSDIGVARIIFKRRVSASALASDAFAEATSPVTWSAMDGPSSNAATAR